MFVLFCRVDHCNAHAALGI